MDIIIICLALIALIIGYYYMKKDNFNAEYVTDKSMVLFENGKKYSDFIQEFGFDTVEYNRLKNLYVNNKLTYDNVKEIIE